MSDRIEKKVTLRASLTRVWRAISDSKEFGTWFGVELDGPFTAGAHRKGKLVPTKVDPEVAKRQQAYEGLLFDFMVERVEPERHLSFRWHPFAIDKAVDYSAAPMTLVVFELEEVSGGTLVTIVESGFDRIPLERRAKAFAANEGGWSAQARLLESYLSHAA